MASREPTETTNLDIYGNATLEWSRALQALSVPPDENLTWFLGTVDPDGQPHAAGVGALFIDGDIYIASGPTTRKSRNLAANPASSVSIALKGIDMVFEGKADRVTDKETLDGVAAVFQKGGWPVKVEDDAFTAPFSAPSAGTPPWYLYRFTFDTAVGVASEEPHGATRWRFGD